MGPTSGSSNIKFSEAAMRSFKEIVGAVILVCLGAQAGIARGQETPAKAAPAKKSPGKDHRTAKGGKEAYQYHEDFGLLPLAKNSLKLELAILGEVDDKPGLPYIRERWHL